MCKTLAELGAYFMHICIDFIVVCKVMAIGMSTGNSNNNLAQRIAFPCFVLDHPMYALANAKPHLHGLCVHVSMLVLVTNVITYDVDNLEGSCDVDLHFRLIWDVYLIPILIII